MDRIHQDILQLRAALRALLDWGRENTGPHELLTAAADALADTAPRVWHFPSRRAGRIVCATSPAAWGASRVLVAWEDGTEGPVAEEELAPIHVY